MKKQQRFYQAHTFQSVNKIASTYLQNINNLYGYLTAAVDTPPTPRLLDRNEIHQYQRHLSWYTYNPHVYNTYNTLITDTRVASRFPHIPYPP